MSHSRNDDLWTVGDLVAEIDAELLAARRRAAWDDARISALEELLETTRRVVGGLGRPATLVDVLESAPTAAERQRRRRLLFALRGGPVSDSPCQRTDTAV